MPSSGSKTPFSINPPLLNSASPWATTSEDLKSLYACPHTGAVTVRTSLLTGFEQHASKHQYTFFSAATGHSTTSVDTTSFGEGRGEVVLNETSSLNTLGYSPIRFNQYLEFLKGLRDTGDLMRENSKPFIVSVTGTPSDIAKCLTELMALQDESYSKERGLYLGMEINLSCPNISDKPPPAYDGRILGEYFRAVANSQDIWRAKGGDVEVHVGVKTPPYTYQGQFLSLIEALELSALLQNGCPISFITATNTLGSCLVLNPNSDPALSGAGIGGMAGDALHPLALGNVKTIRKMLNDSTHETVQSIQIIGVGGVKDKGGFERMRSVGAMAVGVGTGLGRSGVGIFEKISTGH